MARTPVQADPNVPAGGVTPPERIPERQNASDFTASISVLQRAGRRVIKAMTDDEYAPFFMRATYSFNADGLVLRVTNGIKFREWTVQWSQLDREARIENFLLQNERALFDAFKAEIGG